MDAKKRDMTFGQIYGEMIGIFRHFIERKLPNLVRNGLALYDAMGFQFYRGTVEEPFR